MSSAPLHQAHEEQSTTAGQDKIAPEQLVPAKRENSDDVQFISSQPIKKMRLAGTEHGNEDQTAESRAFGPSGEGFAQASTNISMPDRSSSAMPLGIPSHLSEDSAWETRGASLPIMNNFSFLKAHTAASQPAISAAISPKQVPQMAPPSVTGNMQSFGVQASSSRGMTIDQISCLDVRQPFCSSDVSQENNRSNNSGGLSTATTGDTMGKTTMVSTVPNARLASFRSQDSFYTGNPTPSMNYTHPGDLPLESQGVIPSVMYSTENQAHLQQISLPLNASSMPTTSNRGLTSSEASPRPTPWMGGSTDALVPEWSSSSANLPGLHHPRPVRTSEMPLSSAISAWDGISSQPIFQQRRPCLACLAARQQGRQDPSHGQSHGMHYHGNAPMTASVPASWPGLFGLHNQFSPPVLSAIDGGSVQESSQTSAGASSLSFPAYAYPQAKDARLGVRNNTQAGTPPYPSHGSFKVPEMASATAHARSGVGSNNGFGGRVDTMLPGRDTVQNHAHTLDINSTRSGVGSNNDFGGPANTMSPARGTVPNHTLDINGNGTASCRSTTSIPTSTSVPSGMGSNNGPGGPVNAMSPAPGAVLNHSHSQDINPTTSMPPPASVPPTPAMPPHTAMSSNITLGPAQNETKTHANQAQQQPKASGQQQTQANLQDKPHLPCAASQQQQQLPATVSAVTEAAASLAATRKKRAANLLVDAAELVAEIFPYEVVARQHGTLPRKVAEALAAVVQVPLLRCATDKRRTGKLGSDRMKEFREARKGWVAMVREWEKEDDDGEDDAEGEPDEEAVGKNGAGVGRGMVQAPPDPRAVSQPGEPSALNVALLLPPTEMPAQLLRGGFFAGPW